MNIYIPYELVMVAMVIAIVLAYLFMGLLVAVLIMELYPKLNRSGIVDAILMFTWPIALTVAIVKELAQSIYRKFRR